MTVSMVSRKTTRKTGTAKTSTAMAKGVALVDLAQCLGKRGMRSNAKCDEDAITSSGRTEGWGNGRMKMLLLDGELSQI